jgi:hypothetical protein
MPANKFALKGSEVEVDYTIGLTSVISALKSKDEPLRGEFTASQSRVR